MRIPFRRWVGFGIVVLIVILAFGFLVMTVDRSRTRAAKVTCQNNLRVLALLGTPYTRGDDGQIRLAKNARLADTVWPGTVMNDDLKPDERLSWVTFALPGFVEHSVIISDLATSLDLKLAWNQGPNREAATKVLRTLQCPAMPLLPAAGEPAVTMYVGIAGLGTNPATLPLLKPISPRAGAFRYDTATPLSIISEHDGISTTLLFGLTRLNNGPWLRGGSGTVRGLDDSATALPLLGIHGQFGGTLPGGTWFAFADGSVRFFRDDTLPAVLFSLATLAGGKTEFKVDD